jgi:hypothetical protein
MDFFGLENTDEILDMTEEDLNLLTESLIELECIPVSLQEKSVFLLDKNARLKKAGSRASVLAARSANDPLYTELSKLNKKRLILKKKIEMKYKNTARAAMKQLLKDGQVRKADIMVAKAQRAIDE